MKRLRAQSGHILLFTLSVLGILFILTTAALNLVRYDQHFAFQSYSVKQARQIAEGGIDWAIRQLNSNSNYTGEANVVLGEGVFTTVVSGTGSTRTIESSGFIPDATNPKAKRKIIVNAHLGSSNVEFFYGIQVEAGGIQMDNGAGVVGNVYSNGNIVGGNGSYVSGDVIVAGGISDQPQLEWPTENTDQTFATAATNRDIAQSFTATASGTVPKIRVFLGKIGSPSSNITARITTDNSGKPSTSSIASSVIPVSNVGTTPSWIDITFTTPPTVNNNSKYWIVLDYSTDSAVNHWNWRKDNTDGYANNTGRTTSSYSSGSAVWSDVGGDLAFQVWIGGTPTRVEGIAVGSSTSGTGRANSFVNTTIHGSACPNAYCIIDNPAQEPLPVSDGVIQDWKNAAIAGGTTVGDYLLTNNSSDSLGPRRIQGNLTLDNGATLTMTGTIYVTGNVVLSNGCQVNLDPDYGQGSGILITDGTVVISNNCAFSGAMSGGYIMLLTTLDDKNNISMTISNNSVGVVYYAGKTRIQFDNNATAKEATAWGISLSNNAVITYESGLANLLFTSGPGGGWQVQAGTWREVRSF